MINVYLHPYLPIEQTRVASCIETKEEVSVLTGKMINCMKIGNDFFVSREVYRNFKKTGRVPKN